MTGPVHFIWLGGGEWFPQYTRAVKTARRHDAPIIIWTDEPVPTIPDVEVRPLLFHPLYRGHPIGLANVKDYYAYGILRQHGGIYLDLDTISLRPAWDLLPAGKDLLISTEYPENDPHENRNNSAVMIAREGAPVLHGLEDEAFKMLQEGVSIWGAIGPHLVSRYASSRLAAVIEQAPYRALNGWSYHSIGDYYNRPRDPGEPVRVIHLYSSDNLDSFLGDTWMPS